MKFSPFHRILLYYPAGHKFTQNRSISYGFRDIHTFSFSAKIQDGHQKWQKIEIFPLGVGYSCTTLCVKNSLEIALSRKMFEIFTLFHFTLNSKMAAKSGEKGNFSPFMRYSCTTLWVKNSLKIALSLMVFEIFTLFHFTLKFKMAAKSGKN